MSSILAGAIYEVSKRSFDTVPWGFEPDSSKCAHAFGSHQSFSLRSAHPSPRLDFCFILDVQGFDVPDPVSVLVDAAITAEEAHTSDTGDTLGKPCILVLVRGVNEILCLEV
jgi:hypothetical protein